MTFVHRCECGKEIGSASNRCLACHTAASERERTERRIRIAALWAEGLSMAQIASEMGRASKASVSVEMQRMRAAGWELPYRQAGPRKGGKGPPRVPPLTKAQVSQRLSSAILAGKVTRPDACARCGQQGPVDGHHHDYSKPLDVEWLCRPCHMTHHRQMEREAA